MFPTFQLMLVGPVLVAGGPTQGQVLGSTVEGRCFQSDCQENTKLNNNKIYEHFSLSFKFPVYEMYCLRNVLSMKCLVYEISCLSNVLSMKCPSMKCPFYEMSCLQNVLSTKCPVYEMSCL